jgi:hypothetical protein
VDQGALPEGPCAELGTAVQEKQDRFVIATR